MEMRDAKTQIQIRARSRAPVQAPPCRDCRGIVLAVLCWVASEPFGAGGPIGRRGRTWAAWRGL